MPNQRQHQNSKNFQSMQELPKTNADNSAEVEVESSNNFLSRNTRDLQPGQILNLQRTIGNKAVMRLLANRTPTASSRPPLPSFIARKPGDYAKIEQDKKLQVDQEAKEKYKTEAESFELKLGYFLAKDPRSLEGATLMTTKIQKMIDIYADKTSKDVAEYMKNALGKDSEVGIVTGQVRLTFNSLKQTLLNGNLREKMTLVWQVIRSGELANMLEQAAQDIIKAINEKEEDKERAETGWEDVELGEKALLSEELEEKINNLGSDSPLTYAYFDRSPLVANQERRGTEDNEFGELTEEFLKNPLTPNKIKDRGDLPMSYREMKAIFPDETKHVKETNKSSSNNWGSLSQENKANLLQTQVGNKGMQWTPGNFNYVILPALKEWGEQMQVRLLGGISGSADMYFRAADYLGLSLEQKRLVRLASLGTMLPALDHSFTEVMLVGTEFGLTDFAPGPNSYRQIAPLGEQAIKEGTQVQQLPGYYLNDEYKDTLAEKYVD